jgi:hypothetical protein
MNSFERFVSERENPILKSLNYFKPTKIFQNRNDMMGVQVTRSNY